jgi:hypothetical protein
LNDIAQIDADTKFHMTVLIKLCVSRFPFFLNRHGALDRIHHAAKFR